MPHKNSSNTMYGFETSLEDLEKGKSYIVVGRNSGKPHLADFLGNGKFKFRAGFLSGRRHIYLETFRFWRIHEHISPWDLKPGQLYTIKTTWNREGFTAVYRNENIGMFQFDNVGPLEFREILSISAASSISSVGDLVVGKTYKIHRVGKTFTAELESINFNNELFFKGHSPISWDAIVRAEEVEKESCLQSQFTVPVGFVKLTHNYDNILTLTQRVELWNSQTNEFTHFRTIDIEEQRLLTTSGIWYIEKKSSNQSPINWTKPETIAELIQKELLTIGTTFLYRNEEYALLNFVDLESIEATNPNGNTVLFTRWKKVSVKSPEDSLIITNITDMEIGEVYNVDNKYQSFNITVAEFQSGNTVVVSKNGIGYIFDLCIFRKVK